jgi:hypothetical protein
MRCLATIFLALISSPAWANELDSLLQQAQVLGAPMAAVQRAIQISRQPIFPNKDALAIFDISQPSAKKRFYVLDFKSGQVTAHYAAHGRDNGPSVRAIKFKGFQTHLDMVPLGPLKTAHSEVMDHYKTIVDRYDGTVYRNMTFWYSRASPPITVTSTTLPRSNGSSTRTGTPPLLFAPKITACWGGATAALLSIRSKTTSSSRGFRMVLLFTDGRRCPDRTIL